MQLLKDFLDLMLHLQDHLNTFTSQYGPLVYGLLFLIVFCETGLVVTPFLRVRGVGWMGVSPRRRR